MNQKQIIRRTVLTIRNQLSQEALKEKSRSIHEQLFSLAIFQNSNPLFVFLNFGSEVETLPIIEKGLSLGKTVAVPLVTGKETMEFQKITSTKDFMLSNFGVWEPRRDDTATVFPTSKSLMLIPGVAFGKNFHRIGYGKGYYDRYLQKHLMKREQMLGIGFHEQLLDEIPFDAHDIPLGGILTDQELIYY